MTARIYYMIDYLTQGEHKIPVEMLRRPCLHLGPSTGESVLIFGCGCSSSKTNGIEVTVFRLCTPFSNNTDDGRDRGHGPSLVILGSCPGCPKYQASETEQKDGINGCGDSPAQ